ncbi:DEAD/DEAH box helicase [Candidatus Woesearchaeota archaeon]|nr:DEAD/DEAH box helicase [Candidatus Woesearchaeota archaeon]
MQFKGFTLDDFQIKSIEAVERNESVVVSAATGTGKTLIADYVIDKFINQKRRVIYTAPIKALSNQKFRDFKRHYGPESVGIITGDVQINTEAMILVMTTEIYRNMLLSHDPLLDTVAYVVFDEIHYISDIERGTIWEESIIFSPAHLRFLCLSATIPNANQFAAWIESIRKHTVTVVKYAQRAVPLQHLLFDESFGLQEPKEMRNILAIPEQRPRGKHKHDKKKEFPVVSPSDVVKELKSRGLMPCFYFVFSRKECERKAEEVARQFDLLPGAKKGEVGEIFRKVIPEELRELESVRMVRQLASKGVAVHHAGLLPQLKEAVELLFTAGLISVLFTTETFAVGINMPAKAVIFSSLTKWDGMNFRMLNSKEYFQLAGRAGRRGIDTIGYAIGVVDRKMTDLDRYLHLVSGDTEPIRSQFRLSFNTVMHLVAHHNAEEREIILKSNFDYFVQKQEGSHVRIMASFNNKLKALTKMGYVTPDGKMTWKGNFLLNIYANELLLGEIFGTDLHQQLTELELCLLIAGIVFEERKNTIFHTKCRNDEYNRVARQTYDAIIAKLGANRYVQENLNKFALQRLSLLVTRWASGAEFMEILQYTEVPEGDIVHMILRNCDALRQLRHATDDEALKTKLLGCLQRMYRDVVKVNL